MLQVWGLNVKLSVSSTIILWCFTFKSPYNLYGFQIRGKRWFRLIFIFSTTEVSLIVIIRLNNLFYVRNKSRVLPHLLFYRNICLSLIVHICILAIHSRFIGWLLLEKSIINSSIIIITN
jgi:hypothetical protein